MEKETDYLLSETHAAGKSKAKFFRSHGFTDTTADDLAQGLLEIAKNASVESSERSPYGTKYIIDGELETPNGDMIQVRTIWIIEKDDDVPRFVTAYPAE